MPQKSPDILVIVPPYFHMMFSIQPQNLFSIFTRFEEWISSYLPHTFTYWIPGYQQNTAWLPPHRLHKKIFGGTGSEQILKMNMILFKALQPYLTDPKVSTYSIWDLFQAHVADWGCDTAHMLPVWYRKIMGQLLEIHCNSIK